MSPRTVGLTLLLALTAAACGSDTRTAPPDPSAAGAAARAGGDVSGGARTFVIVPEESKASYVADEELFQLALTKFGLPPGWTKVVGSTTDVSGRFAFDPARLTGAPGTNEFTVRLNTLKTGRDMRDDWIRENGPRFNDHPLATFTATAIEAESSTAAGGGELAFTLRGPLTIRDVARPTAFLVRARLDADALRGTATTRLKMSDFGIDTITFYETLTVSDEIGLEIEFTARHAPQPQPVRR